MDRGCLRTLVSVALIGMYTHLVQGGEVHDALVQGEIEKAKSLLANDPDLVHSCDGRNRTPLHLAARFGHVKLARWLLEHGADVNARAYNGFTPLHLATDPTVAKILLEHGADIEALTSYGDSALQRAAQKGTLPRAPHGQAVSKLLITAGAYYDIRTAIYLGDVDRVRELLKSDASLANKRDHHSYAPLHWAAKLGRASIVKLLLEQGVNVDARERWWESTPLAMALAHPPVVRLLLEAGADPNVRTRGRGYDANSKLLDRAARAGQMETAKLLLVHSVDAGLRSESGFTPLHAAAVVGHEWMVRLLHREGLAADAATASGWTPMSLAASRIQPDSEKTKEGNAKYKAVIRFLNDRGVPFGLFGAIALDKADRVAALLKADPALANRKKPGEPVLHFAVKLNRKDVVAVLLRVGADVNITGEHGATALHHAAIWGREDIAKILIDRNANVNATDDHGIKPLHESARLGTPTVARLLLGAGAEANARDNRGRTPLACVGTFGNPSEVTEILLEHGGTK